MMSAAAQAGTAPVPPKGSAAWAEVEDLIRASVARLARRAGVVLSITILAGWVTDFFLLQGDAQVRATMAEMRLGLVVVVALWLLVARTRLVDRAPVLTAAPVVWGASAWMGWKLGQIGGLDSPWPYYLYFMLGLQLLAAAPLVTQAVFAAGTMASIFLGFFVLHPAHLAHPLAPDALAFLGVVGLVTVVMAHGLWSRTVTLFVQRLALAQSAERLAALNAVLDERVRQQTADLRALGARLVEVQEQERQRLARDLHDQLGQQLSAMRYLVSAMGAEAGPLAEPLEAALAAAVDTTRQVVNRLRPMVLEQLGLAAAYEWLLRSVGEQSGLQVSLECQGDDAAVPEGVALASYRVLQEALGNVVRHAQARHVWVALVVDAGSLRLEVTDDGVGLPATPAPRGDGSGLGVLGMRERAQANGGELALAGLPEGGTRVTLTLPLHPGEAA